VYARDGIRSDAGITTNWSILTYGVLEANEAITANGDIEAGQIFGASIQTTGGLVSTGRIVCDEIQVAEGIVSWREIEVSGNIECGKRIFCGIDTEFTGDNPVHRTITCSKLLSGEVAYGILVETGDTPAE